MCVCVCLVCNFLLFLFLSCLLLVSAFSLFFTTCSSGLQSFTFFFLNENNTNVCVCVRARTCVCVCVCACAVSVCYICMWLCVSVSSGRISRLNSNFLWTGANDRQTEQGWRWADGSPMAFINWKPRTSPSACQATNPLSHAVPLPLQLLSALKHYCSLYIMWLCRVTYFYVYSLLD